MQVGVIGAGVMGSGIAQVLAAAEDTEVLLCDASLQLAEQGRERILERLARNVSKGKLTAETKDEIAAKISVCDIGDLSGCDLIIEAIKEDLVLKKELFARLSSLCKRDCILASNTSALSLEEISEGLPRPVLGLHFFNPVPAMKLVEIIVPHGMPETVVAFARNFVEKIGKTPVTVKDSAGFVVNRLLIPMINEAVAILDEGVASAEAIDTAMRLGAEHPIGPLALGDLIGLDVCLAISEVLDMKLPGGKYRPHPLLVKMVADGSFGRKSGKGFYDYERV